MFELWFELGIVGVRRRDLRHRADVPAGRRRAPGPVAPLLLGGLMSALFVSGFGVGISPIWWVTILALDGLAFALVLRGQFRGRRPSVRDIDGARIGTGTPGHRKPQGCALIAANGRRIIRLDSFGPRIAQAAGNVRNKKR